MASSRRRAGPIRRDDHKRRSAWTGLRLVAATDDADYGSRPSPGRRGWGSTHRRQMPCTSIRLDERVFVLGVAHDQGPCAVALIDDELPAIGAWIDRDERRGLVAIVPRADDAPPGAKAES